MIYWEKIRLDDHYGLNIVNPNIKMDNGLCQDMLTGLSEREQDRFRDSIPPEYLKLPLYINGIKCVLKGEK